ncbi:MAG: DUF4198 domain-containing protein, partial [Candidatus Thermoplasmatota archaeon]|nr:DUF4198 domain-containing protein [Candidatus Thermoplasmatota archaeon]
DSLTVDTTGAVTFTGAVGSGVSTKLSTLTITNSAALLFSSTINITGALTQTNAATGTTTFTVAAPDEMIMIVENMVEEVLVTEVSGCHWRNASTIITINLYGEDQDTHMNASINITGCGVDISIDEEDAIDDGYWVDDGVYSIDVSPRYAGTLTITATNDTEEKSVTKDFTVDGLAGSVSTSVGDDLEIAVLSTENIEVTVDGQSRADIHLTYFNENWGFIRCLNDTTGDNTAGNGLNGVYTFDIIKDDIEEGVGYIVAAAEVGGAYMFDIVEVAPKHDLEIVITSPVNATNKLLTVGLDHTYILKVYDADGKLIEDIDSVEGVIIDEDEDELQNVIFAKKAGGIWQIKDWNPFYVGTFVITATNDTGENEHDGNISLDVDLATITYSPDTATAGIEKEDLEIQVVGIDANGELLPDQTDLYLNIENSTTLEIEGVDTVTLDEDGTGTFTITCVGDNKTYINATLLEFFVEAHNTNKTNGQLNINFPVFTVDPSTIYIGMSNQVTITAKDGEGAILEGINITLIGSSVGIISSQPDPVMTDENGIVILEIEPEASGKLNVTIASNLHYDAGLLHWTNAVVTDTYISVTSLKTMTIEVSKSPINEGETLTVTIRSGITPVSGVVVTFGSLTGQTGSVGTVDFTVPDPGNVDYSIYKVKAQKTGYITPSSEDVTVLKKWDITIVVPTDVYAGESFTVSIIAKGQPLAGATVKLDGTTTVTSDGDGKATFTAGAKDKTHTITATYDPYTPGQATVGPVKEKGVPGFELLTLVIAIGIAFILLRRRKQN